MLLLKTSFSMNFKFEISIFFHSCALIKCYIINYCQICRKKQYHKFFVSYYHVMHMIIGKDTHKKKIYHLPMLKFNIRNQCFNSFIALIYMFIAHPMIVMQNENFTRINSSSKLINCQIIWTRH